MQSLQVQSATGSDYGQLLNAYNKWVEMKNSGKGYEADVMMSNTFDGVRRKVWKQHDPLILICTLFMCEESEDRRVWDEESANEKIKIWNDGGYPAENFTRWGVRFSEVYQTNWSADTQTISEGRE
jgi:hypothetical protein